ncbi:MAG TPA: GAF and ANTAR domain-containing protein [Nocardioidaceae bacterium]|nr:GAF and ANTAR domain-containing protein [Nocardioidaceae bacterium]
MTTQNEPRIEQAAQGAPGAVFDGLARLVYGAETYAEVYQAICDAALRLVDGCDHASLTLAERGDLVTAAATDETARVIDHIEREEGEGPCVDAISEEAAQLDTDLTDGTPWPALRERVLAETPVRSTAGFRIMVDDRKVGALNLFGDAPGSLDERSVDQAAVLAAFASVALRSAADHEQARTLREGLRSNREIGKAVGLMMAFHKVDDEEAFDILRRASQEMNVKLSEVARQVVEHHNQRPRP